MYKLRGIIVVILLKSTFSFCQKRENKKKFENEINKFERLDKKQPVSDSVILFVGSSSIKFWKDISDSFPGHNILNRGFGGSQFSDLLFYTDRIVLPYEPMKIFVYEGDNDIGDNKKVKKVFRQAKRFRKTIFKKLPNTLVVFISPKPSIARWSLKEDYQKLNQKLKKYASVSRNTEFANVWDPVLDENGEVMKDIFLEDGLHMNSKGYAIWVEILKQFVDSEY